MSGLDILLLVAVIAAVVGAFFLARRARKKGSACGCGCGCSGCSPKNPQCKAEKPQTDRE